ncbi:MAG: hypothetical protein Q8T11_07565 [Elusimicrobiota bacterium]|nr:hypothetical protein [Elusimicrobiota bacterium]
MNANKLLLLALAGVLSGCAGASKSQRPCIAPGDTARIEFPIENTGRPGSNERLEEVQISAVPPANFPFSVTDIKIKEDPSLKIPITIEPGTTRTFVIAYRIDDAAKSTPDGEYTVALKVGMLNVYTTPGPGALDSEIKLNFVKGCPSGN